MFCPFFLHADDVFEFYRQTSHRYISQFNAHFYNFSRTMAKKSVEDSSCGVKCRSSDSEYNWHTERSRNAQFLLCLDVSFSSHDRFHWIFTHAQSGGKFSHSNFITSHQPTMTSSSNIQVLWWFCTKSAMKRATKSKWLLIWFNYMPKHISLIRLCGSSVWIFTAQKRRKHWILMESWLANRAIFDLFFFFFFATIQSNALAALRIGGNFCGMCWRGINIRLKHGSL